jgi:hypothetical protein
MKASAIDNLVHPGLPWQSLLAMGAAVVLGALAVFFWVLVFSKKRKRKRKHRSHKRINPTLAEVGGLPPVRRPGERLPDDPAPFDP